jgi:pimeloyl-ACP methyl ester carboxylesterase
MVQTVCLLSGLLCDDTVWATQAHALRQNNDVRVMHFAGFDSISAMAEHVLANMPARFSLAGHSMGGRVALEVYRQAPERVQKLALLDTGYGPAAEDEAEKRGLLVRKALTDGIDAIAETWACPMIAPCNLADEELLDRILNMVGRMSGEIYARQTKALLTRPDATPVLPGIDCPTLVLCGKQDTWSPPARHEYMAASIPGSILRLIDDCGHMSPMEQPHEVLASLEDWIAMTPHHGDKTNE